MFDHDENDDRDKIRVAYQHLIHKYARCVKGNDDNLKRVIEYLESEGLFDNTVVVYLSDQGYWLGQHGFFDKRLILESSMRTPFMIRYPKLIKPGSVNTDLCVNIDIAPTLLEIAGVEIPAAMQGRSMLPLLRGEKVPDGREAQWYSYWSNPNHHGIRTERYTYIKVPGHDVEL
ncbi:MAG: sulfatase-like hydrolase/transferase, partial [Deltaproteobacteria bacterium]|nr:sulfatase-like hydrolase/transferase [Deltaproteobacteria bacterium]